MPVSRKVNPGRFDMLLTFQSKSITTDSIGDKVETWSNYRSAYGEVKQLSGGGGEGFEASQLVSKAMISAKVRYDSGLAETMRFTINGSSEYYHITDVQGWQREGYTMLIAQKRDNQ